MLITLFLTLCAALTSSLKPKEALTFVMMAKTTGFKTRTYTNALHHKAKYFNSNAAMAWHSHYQLQTRCRILSFAVTNSALEFLLVYNNAKRLCDVLLILLAANTNEI